MFPQAIRAGLPGARVLTFGISAPGHAPVGRPPGAGKL